jgi:hypothetical protein
MNIEYTSKIEDKQEVSLKDVSYFVLMIKYLEYFALKVI